LLQANLLHLISTKNSNSAAIIPIHMSINIKTDNKLRIRLIRVTLTAFIMVHSAYHIFGFFGYSLIADGFFEPLSVMISVVFAILMARVLSPNSVAIKKTKG
jgi:hypothetical protein